ncbi:MAG: BatD family protein [Gammaproteobacteria bacterium]
MKGRAACCMRLGASLCLLLAGVSVSAATPRAWLQPERIALGESTTLHVEADGDGNMAPDFSALQKDFDLRGQSSSTSMTLQNWHTESHISYEVILEPRASGVYTIPPLKVGNGATQAITLAVTPATPGSAQRGDQIYFESELATHDPYVQQVVSYTVRLYYAVALVEGQVDVNAPDNASLEQVGKDQTTEQFIDGQRFRVLERHYLLTPEKSGPMTLPPPRFSGRARSSNGIGFFNSLAPVSQVGRQETLDVQPLPAAAPTPWLVVDRLSLTRADVAGEVRAGEPLMLEYKLFAEGATASQLPELQLPAVPGAQVFPEPQQSSDDIVDGRPEATVTRRFAVVPAHVGKLQVPDMSVNYWSAKTDQAATGTVPGMAVNVTPGVVSQPGSSTPPLAAPASPVSTLPTVAAPDGHANKIAASSAAADDVQALRLWQAATAALGLGLALTLAWGWRRGRRPVSAVTAVQPPGTPIADSAPDLQRALSRGELRQIAAALRATTSPACATLGVLQAKLSDPQQRAAVEALERSLWASSGNDRQQTLEQLRQAFRAGPQFIAERTSAGQDGLPPLYPPRNQSAV